MSSSAVRDLPSSSQLRGLRFLDIATQTKLIQQKTFNAYQLLLAQCGWLLARTAARFA